MLPLCFAYERHTNADGSYSSANQSAIISSRLTTYLRRPWSALSPCPVGKELIGTHPKRIFFYLTTCPHQAFPDPDTLNAQQAQQRQASRIISPSLSSAAGSAAGDELDQHKMRSREQLSPSPELDLELDLSATHLGSTDFDMSNDIDMDLDPDVASLSRTYSGRGSLSRDGTHPPTDSNMSHNRRAVSPPLEGDEREFTQTASEVQMLVMRKRAEEKEERERRASRELSLSSKSASDGNSADGPATPNSSGSLDDDTDVKMESASNPDLDNEDEIPIVVEESEETCAQRNSECAAALFGSNGVGMLNIASPMLSGKAVHFVSSPLVKPTVNIKPTEKNLKWSELEVRSPETVDLDELDDLFDSF